MIALSEESTANVVYEYLEDGLHSTTLNGFISDFTQLFLLLLVLGICLRLIQGGIKAINEDSGLMKFFKASKIKILAVIIGICVESIILLVKGVYK